MGDIFKEIVKYMLSVNRPVKSSELAVKLDIKVRTVRYEISKEKDSLISYGVELESLGKSGYRLQVVDEKKASLLRDELLVQGVPDNKLQERILYFLLNSAGYCKLDDLADSLFVSRSTINRLMKAVRQMLAEFTLDLEAKPYFGVKITGLELNKRLCIAKYFPDEAFGREGDDESMDRYRLAIAVVVKNVLEKYHFKIKDVRFANLVLHLSIAVDRIKNNNLVNDVADIADVSPAWDIANAIAKELEAQFAIEMPSAEVNYISLHLLGKQDLEKLAAEDELLNCLLNNILGEIEYELGYSLGQDFELYMHLMLHLKPLLVRAKYHMQFENSLLYHIKAEMQEGFECALIAKRVIEEQTELFLSDEELGYLAIHFALALSNMRSKKKVLIVCSSGSGTSMVLRKKILNHFGSENIDVELGNYLSVGEMSLEGYDYIFSTVPLALEKDYPVIYVENVFSFQFENHERSRSHRDEVFSVLKREHLLLELKGQSRDEILTEMIGHLVEDFHVSAEVGESIMRREQISSTEVGNQIAMPHPVKRMTEETIILVGVLKNEILWSRKKVKCVILVCYAKQDSPVQEKINDRITDFVIDTQKVAGFLKNPSYESLMKSL